MANESELAAPKQLAKMTMLARKLRASGDKTAGRELVELAETITGTEDPQSEEVCREIAKGFRSQKSSIRRECQNAMEKVMYRLGESRFEGVQNALACMVEEDLFAWSRLIALELCDFERKPKACLRLLEDGELILKHAALDALCPYSEDPRYRKELLAVALKYVAHGQDPLLRVAAAEVLRSSRSFEGRDALLQLLQDERCSSELLTVAIRGYSELDRGAKEGESEEAHEAKECGALGPLLQHGNASVRENAAYALAMGTGGPHGLALAAVMHRPVWPETHEDVLEAKMQASNGLSDLRQSWIQRGTLEQGIEQ